MIIVEVNFASYTGYIGSMGGMRIVEIDGAPYSLRFDITRDGLSE